MTSEQYAGVGTVTDARVHERVRRWAERHPTAPAVAAGEVTLTYRDLDARADALAAELRARGVGPEAAVAVALPRSPEFVVAGLAVWRAGGYYVPIDPGYPEQRRALMAADAGARWAVTRKGAPDPFPSADIGRVDLSLEGPPHPAEPMRTTVAADSLAYAVYTSGSTGTPKGVAVTHANLTDLVDGDPRLGIGPTDAVAHLAPTAFDASVFEVWSALARGACVRLIAADEVSVAAIDRDLRAWRPDWLFITTGLFHALAEHACEALGHVGTVITGGDVLSPRHVRAAARSAGTVYAAYGPTEATVFSSLHRVASDRAYERVPLGSPLHGRTMYVLDDAMRPVPDGRVGEIYIGGGGVARGYVNRPRLSAERFVPDPFADEPGRLLYRSGDLGRRLPDGDVEFCGRVDRQAKIRGFRVEPGETEAALLTCEGVESVTVSVLDGPDGDKRLVAYVVPCAGEPVGADELRATAAELLPPYARPSYYLVVQTLPLGPNGKVDRAALPDPWRRRDLLDLPPVTAPRTATEELVATVVAESLGLDRVGRDDDFFAIGGSSLQSVQVLERLRSGQVSLTSRELFANPVVADLAALIDRKAAVMPDAIGRPQ